MPILPHQISGSTQWFPAYQPTYPGSQSQADDRMMNRLLKQGGHIPHSRTLRKYYKRELENLTARANLEQARTQSMAMLHNIQQENQQLATSALRNQAQHNPFFGPNIARQSFRF